MLLYEFNRFEEVGIGQNRSKVNVSTRECVEKDDLRRRASYERVGFLGRSSDDKKKEEDKPGGGKYYWRALGGQKN